MCTYTDSKKLCLLAWADTQERLDNLLLEIRHLQQCIIYFLRSPILYRPLRYEESFLFEERGCNWEIDDSKNITNISIIDYPYTKDKEEIELLDTEYSIIKSRLIKFINDQWHQGKWTTEQQRFYYSLISLQNLKKNIFNDKIILYKYSRKSINIASVKNQDLKIVFTNYGKFHIIRSGISSKIKEYIEILGDFQSQLAKAQDIGLLDHPRPSTERRREQRLFTATMADKCRNLWREFNHLWLFLDPKNKTNGTETPIIVHRWKHCFTSEVEQFTNNINEENCKEHVVINTSYFMPERPDLKCLAAHEVCHAYLNKIYDDFSTQTLSRSNHPFSRVIRRIQDCIEISGYNVNDLQLYLIKEISVDLLTSSIQGTNYLYALFLELMGSGLEDLLRSGYSHEIDLDMINYLDGMAGELDQTRNWYLRLTLISTWLKEVIPNDISQPYYKLSENIIDAINFHCDSLIYYLDLISRPGKGSVEYWKKLKTRLIEIVRTCEVRSGISKWWKDRRIDYYGCESYKGIRLWPIPLLPLDAQARKFIFTWLITARRQFMEEFSFTDKDFNKQLLSYHLPNEADLEKLWQKSSVNNFSTITKAQSIFEFPEDVPWQLSLIFAEDFLSVNLSDHKKIIKEIRYLHTLVRVGYQYAIEFYFSGMEPPTVKLEDTIGILSYDNIEKLDDTYSNYMPSETWNMLKSWRGEIEIEKSNLPLIEKGINAIEKNLNRKNQYLQRHYLIKKCFDISKKFTAKDFGYYSAILSRKSELHRAIFYRIIIFKLRYLKRMIKNYDISFLSPLYKNLEIIDKKNSDNTHDVYATICESFYTNNYDKKPTRPFLNGKISEGSFYKTYNINNFILNESRDSNDANIDYYKVTGLIGRYDKFISDILDKDATYNLPRYEKYIKSNFFIDPYEKFLPFFVRWEYGIPVRLKSSKWDDVKNCTPIGYISILLNRASSRLNMLYRILRACNYKYFDNLAEFYRRDSIEGLSDLIHGNDYAFISDGGEDIILVICGTPNDVCRLFEIQDILYNDYSVSRTEMNLSTCSLDYLLCNNNDSRLRIMYRLIDTRSLSNANNDFVKKIDEKLNSLVVDGYIFPFLSTLTKTPGRMDFSLRLWSPNQDLLNSRNLGNCVNKNSTFDLNYEGCQCDIENYESFNLRCKIINELSDKYANIIDEINDVNNLDKVYKHQLIYDILFRLCKGCSVDRVQTNFGKIQ